MSAFDQPFDAAEAERKRTAEWTCVRDQVPLPGIVVETKIDDEMGVRNVQRLKREGRLWWFEDGSTYCYYAPTHWRPADAC